MINRRFLNYKHYASFQRDLEQGQLQNDAIVFIQDPEHTCIWTHGKEYLSGGSYRSDLDSGILSFKDTLGNVVFKITQNNGNITIEDSDGDRLTQRYITRTEFETDRQATSNNIDNITSNIDNITDDINNIASDVNTIKKRFVTLSEGSYQRLVDNNSIDSDTYYFTYEGGPEGWSFGDEFPIILIDTWAFGGTFPIKLS